jgi:uncharacterized RDD family membrane protein YckC
MKCPKCGYIGFERAEKCRNCGYDFSLVSDSLSELDLPLRRDEPLAAPADFDFSTGETPGPATAPRSRNSDFDLPAPTPAARELPLLPASPASSPSMTPALVPTVRPRPATPAPASPSPVPVAPPAAVAPRRQNLSPPRVRAVPAAFDFKEAEPGLEPETSSERAPSARARSGAAAEPAGSLARAIAGMLDAIILLGVNAAVLYFTLRICRLSVGDILVLPLAPLIAFFMVVDGGYLIAFTAVGGQTIGKMAASLKVISEEGGPVVPGQAALRAAGYLASFLPAGLGFVPGLFGPSRRALHDRLANTRVVRF